MKTNQTNLAPTMEKDSLWQVKWIETREKDIKPQIEVINFESRRYPRFHIKLPIEYYGIKSSITHTGNISEDGLLIYFSEEMDLTQHLKLKLFFSSGSELNTIEVLAEVAWMDDHLSQNWENYRCGIRFIDMSPEDRAKLGNLLRNLSSPLEDES
jgi:c-di-GMP-binding flagellar brake protein YcgR